MQSFINSINPFSRSPSPDIEISPFQESVQMGEADEKVQKVVPFSDSGPHDIPFSLSDREIVVAHENKTSSSSCMVPKDSEIDLHIAQFEIVLNAQQEENLSLKIGAFISNSRNSLIIERGKWMEFFKPVEKTEDTKNSTDTFFTKASSSILAVGSNFFGGFPLFPSKKTEKDEIQISALVPTTINAIENSYESLTLLMDVLKDSPDFVSEFIHSGRPFQKNEILEEFREIVLDIKESLEEDLFAKTRTEENFSPLVAKAENFLQFIEKNKDEDIAEEFHSLEVEESSSIDPSETASLEETFEEDVLEEEKDHSSEAVPTFSTHAKNSESKKKTTLKRSEEVILNAFEINGRKLRDYVDQLNAAQKGAFLQLFSTYLSSKNRRISSLIGMSEGLPPVNGQMIATALLNLRIDKEKTAQNHVYLGRILAKYLK